MVRCIPSRSYGFGYVSGGCYIADIVHQEIYQFFKKNLVSNLVFFIVYPYQLFKEYTL